VPLVIILALRVAYLGFAFSIITIVSLLVSLALFVRNVWITYKHETSRLR
jgi:hypothetical protein